VRWGTLLRGWALAELGEVDRGIAQMQESLAAHRAIRQLIIFPYELGLLAATLAKAGRIDEGLAAVQEALAVVAATDQRFYEAELYRQRGEILLRGAGTPPEAEVCFRQALAVAGRQQAKSLELRAATSLARLWGEQGKGGEARDLLAPVYGWFTEGFETADVRAAKALLEALS